MKLEKGEDISAYYRGLLIQDTIELELRMDIVIGRFLSMNNQDRTLDLIEIFDIAKIDFSSKMTILIYIIKKHFPNFKNEKSEQTDYRSNFFEFLEYVMTKRNILAHRRPDFNNQNYLRLNWAKTAKKSIQENDLILDSNFVKEFKLKFSESFIMLIELENKIIEWSKDSFSRK